MLQAMDVLFAQLLPLLDTISAANDDSLASNISVLGDSKVDTLTAMYTESRQHISELQTALRRSQELALVNLQILKESNSNFGSSYYWIIFVLLYAGVYLFQ
jgi:hypothetical protein